MSGFSVLMSLYDKENAENLRTSLESVFSQTLKPSEVILVFDGVKDANLKSVVSEFKTKYDSLSIIVLDNNQGLGKALKTGLEHCSFNLVARMDTDDICYPDRFEKQVAYMVQNPDISVVGTPIHEFRDKIGDTNTYRSPPADFEDLVRFSKYRNPLNHPSVLFKKDDVLNAGSYVDIPSFEDYYLWIRMLNKGLKIMNMQEPLLHFRIGNDMIGRRHGISYLKKEMVFLKELKRIGYVNYYEYYRSIILKAPVRLLPKKILYLFYKFFLR